MHVLLVEIDLELPACHSLKDKRSVLKSIQARVRSTYNASIAEVDHQDLWNASTLAVVTVATLERTVESTIRSILDEMESRFYLVVLAERREWLY